MSIKLTNISKRYDDFSLKDISFDIEKGEYLVILGPSGSGKTVLLELIAGITSLDGGTIEGMTGISTGFIYQDYMLFTHLTVSENIAYGLKVRKIDKDLIRECVNEISAKLNIAGLLNRDVQTLSGGEKQRVAIARAAVIEPAIFFLDEPTAALDQNKKSEIQKLLINLQKETSATFVHVTHDYEEALAIADRIIVIREGEIVQIDHPENIFNKPNSKFVADFVGYRNVFWGEITDNIFKTNDVEIYVSSKNAESAYIAIKSDDVIISKEKLISSAQNSFFGSIIEIRKKISIVEIVVDIGIQVQVNITHKSLTEMNLELNQKFWITFKTSSVMIFEH